MVIIVTVLTLLSRLAMMIQGFTNMTPSTATFSTASMEPEYKDGGSVQYFVKLARNTGYNYNLCADILPHARILIKSQSFTSEQELTFDSEHDWTSAGIAVLVTPGSGYWVGDEYISRVSRVLQLTTSYQEIYRYDGLPDEKWFWIKSNGTTGFKIKNDIAATRALTCMIVRGNIHTGA